MTKTRLSSVLCLLSSRLAPRVSRPRRLARGASHAATALALALLTFSLLLFTSSFVFADVPVSINYVGHLDGVGASGESTALVEKNILMVFRLYDVPGSGKTSEKATALWGRQASVALTDGDFDIDLADNFGAVIADTKYTSLSDALRYAAASGSSDLYLGLTPANDSNAEIFPRQKLTAVPKALQALYVTTVPNDFTVTGGVFSADAIEVTGSAEIQAGARYHTTTIPETTPMTFCGGIDVGNTLRARRTDATVVKADTVETGLLKTDSSATVSVTGRLEAAGTPVWNGALKADSATLAAGTVSGAVSAQTVSSDTLTVGTLALAPTKYLDEENKSWRIVGPIEEQTVREASEVNNIAFTAWNSYSERTASKNAILASYWTAPYDCIAYFQTYVKNATSGSDLTVASIQFYIVEDPDVTDFTSRHAVGYASADQAMTVKTVVPILVRKGEIVKWLAYNANENKAVGVKELGDTKVTAIRCQPFNW